MTINFIIEQLYNSKEVDDCIKKMVRQDHRQDFKQELFLKIYEIPQERMFALYQSNGLKFYIVRSLINLVKNNSSVYNKNYIRPERDRVEIYCDNDEEKKDTQFIDEYDPEDIIKRAASEDMEQWLVSEIDRMDEELRTTDYDEMPYYKSLVYLIREQGGMRAASRLTGIPVASISEAVKKVRNYLNNKCYNDPQVIKGVY